MNTDDPEIPGAPESPRDSATGRIRPGHTLPGGGRPRKSLAPAAGPVTRAMDEHVTVTENNRRRRIPKRDINAKQVVNKGSGGDLRAAKLAFELEAKERAAAAAAAAAAQLPAVAEDLAETDQQIADRLVARLRIIIKEEDHGPDAAG